MSNVLMNKIRFAQLGFRSSDSFWCVMGYDSWVMKIWGGYDWIWPIWNEWVKNNMGNIGINGSIKINLELGYYAHSTTWVDHVIYSQNVNINGSQVYFWKVAWWKISVKMSNFLPSKNFEKIPYPESRKIFTFLDDLFFFFG